MKIKQLIIYFSNLKNKDFHFCKNLILANKFCKKMAKKRKVKPESKIIDWHECGQRYEPLNIQK